MLQSSVNVNPSLRLKGPPPALEGPLAVNTRLQNGRRLFAGKLHGPESFTADEEGERLHLNSFSEVTLSRAGWV